MDNEQGAHAGVIYTPINGVCYILFRSFDEILDAEYGKIGTPKRDQYQKEVDA